jgi:hypothetical protein
MSETLQRVVIAADARRKRAERRTRALRDVLYLIATRPCAAKDCNAARLAMEAIRADRSAALERDDLAEAP